MNTREQFGNYLLLKKLGEDPLGESFRAGRIGSQGMEQVALLRAFNGTGIEGNAFWQAVSDREPIQKALRSPNLGTGVDLGQVRSVPYAAYDYISGKNLAELIDQAGKRNNPIPPDHALLIAERIALGLAVGYETRYGDDRLLHGALVPHLVMISNEGETKLLGFDIGPGLRQAIQGGAAASLAHYLSPEARGGRPATKADDVYSLGVILLELITGRSVAGADLGALIDETEMGPEGTPIPDELKNLIRLSFAPESERLGDAVGWHKTLSKMMFEGQFNPTTFNLAFYMHNLFRDEIEKETHEIEVEKTMEIPISASSPPAAAAAAPPPAVTPAPGPPAAADPKEHTATGTNAIRDRYGIDEKEGSGKGKVLWIGIAAAVIIIGGGVAFMMTQKGGSEAQTAEVQGPGSEPALPPVTPPLIAPESELPGNDESVSEAAASAEAAQEKRDALETQIEDLVAKETEKYDQELEALRAQLDDARQRAATAEEAQVAAVKEVEEQQVEEPPAEEPAVTEPPAVAEAATAPPELEPETEPEIPAEETQQAEAAPPPVPEPRTTAPPEEKVTRGELVTLGAGVTAPKRTKMRPLTYPPVARRMRKEATVVVRVLIDENGKVLDAQLKGKKVGYGLDEEALSAAKSARFNPARKKGVPVKIWWEVPIQFKL